MGGSSRDIRSNDETLIEGVSYDTSWVDFTTKYVSSRGSGPATYGSKFIFGSAGTDGGISINMAFRASSLRRHNKVRSVVPSSVTCSLATDSR